MFAKIGLVLAVLVAVLGAQRLEALGGEVPSNAVVTAALSRDLGPHATVHGLAETQCARRRSALYGNGVFLCAATADVTLDGERAPRTFALTLVAFDGAYVVAQR